MGAPSSLIVRGLIGIVVGLLAIMWPGITLAVLVTIFGAYAILDGVSILVHGVAGMYERSWASILRGVLGICAGILAVAWPGITALALVLLVATWAGAMGLLDIVDAVRLRQSILSESLQGLVGIMSLLFGGLMFAFPGAGAFALATLFGIYAIACGFVLVTLGLRLRAGVAA
jgi:uncharacterized membrane protein HdeD (DUF308 family)